jgi:hypothetical protein
LGLPDAARTVQVRDGKPQVKNEPHLGKGVAGYLVFEADNIEAALALAARIPVVRLGGGRGSPHGRAVLVIGGFGHRSCVAYPRHLAPWGEALPDR